MTIIFRQRTFSKRWKIQKDWNVGENHTTATIVADEKRHVLISDKKIAECKCCISSIESMGIIEGGTIFIDDNAHNIECGTYYKISKIYYKISKIMRDTNWRLIVYLEDEIKEDFSSKQDKWELEDKLLNVNNLEEYKRTHKYKHRFFNFKKG